MLVGIVPGIMESMSEHKDVPSVQYWGFLNLRTLFRPPFLKPSQVDELLSESAVMGTGAACSFIYVYIYLYVYVNVCMCVNMYICVCICTYYTSIGE